MKKLLTIAIASLSLMAISSCDKGGNEGPIGGVAQCQVTNNATPVSSTIGADGTMYDTQVIYYNGSSEISSKQVGNLSTSGGASSVLDAPEGATQARIAFKLLPSTNTDPANVMQYTVDYFALTGGKLTAISITDQTMLTSTKGDTKGAVMTLSEALAQF